MRSKLVYRLFSIFVIFFLISTVPIVSVTANSILDDIDDVLVLYIQDNERIFEKIEKPNVDITEYHYEIQDDQLLIKLIVEGEISKNSTYLLYLISNGNIFSKNALYSFKYENGNINHSSNLIDYEIGENWIICRFILDKVSDETKFLPLSIAAGYNNSHTWIDLCPEFLSIYLLYFALPGKNPWDKQFLFGRGINISIYNGHQNKSANCNVNISNRAIIGSSTTHICLNFTIQPKSSIMRYYPSLKPKPFICVTEITFDFVDFNCISFFRFISFGQWYYLYDIGWEYISEKDFIKFQYQYSNKRISLLSELFYVLAY